MVKKLLYCFVLLSVCASLIAQTTLGVTPGTAFNSIVEENTPIRQVLRWDWHNVLYCRVEIEEYTDKALWVLSENLQTAENFIELNLLPGLYRFRIHDYNSNERIIATSSWTQLQVFPLIPPRAEIIDRIDVFSSSTDFNIVITGEDLLEGAKVYLISQKRGAFQMPAMSLEYSEDGTSIKANFSTRGINRGLHNLVITNPGGLSQTLEGIELVYLGEDIASIAGNYDLSGKSLWALNAMPYVGYNFDINSSSSREYDIESLSEYIYGITINYTFFESYKAFGEISFLPTSFFMELNCMLKNRINTLGHKWGPQIIYDRWNSEIAAGVLYKTRVGKQQRFLIKAGVGFGCGLCFTDSTLYDAPDPNNVLVAKVSDGDSKTFFYMFMDLRTGLSYRISPNWALDFSINLGINFKEEIVDAYGIYNARPQMAIFSLGVTRSFSYD